jgi:hypothetical protein
MITERILIFLDKNLNPRKRGLLDPGSACKLNAEEGARMFGFPAEAWNSLTAELRSRDCERSDAWLRCKNSFESAVMMGFAIGWYESKNQKAKP